MSRNPTASLTAAVDRFYENQTIVMSIGGEAAKLSDTPAERAPFVSYLVGRPIFEKGAATEGLKDDRLLDAVLGNWLFGAWDDALWDQGIRDLRRSGSGLALDTYNLYGAIACASVSEIPALVESGDDLFNMRRKDKFFSGGDQTEGGGPDNQFTVDYRLASLSKRVGYKGQGKHAWHW